MASSAPAKRAPRKAAATTRRAPAKKAAPARTATVAPADGGPAVVLDLDSLSKQKAFPKIKLPAKPFTFLLNGVVYELKDPRDADWKRVLELAQNPFLLMRTSLVGADDQVEDPTELEIECARERLRLSPVAPKAGSEEAKQEAADYPDGVPVLLIDRLTAADLPTWKLNALFANWHEHYRIDMSSSKGVLSALLGTDE